MSNKELFISKLNELIDKFSRNEEYYKSKSYKGDVLMQECISEVKIADQINQMLETQKQLHSENITDSQKKLLEQRAENLDKQIDGLVYELYGLSEEEIKIVEGGK